ncbi:hypothetical protein SAMN04488004_101127 [Loktanella salsilacus]|uniref:Uncharacterized protein n=1 Tax=Loktanella salsilacus TaxID=195913 RepID=A0A1I4BTR1_9RHOB|nr:DUF5765 domain-containing protein [Loktanella salsilacus]SFK71439.1 hypothetical protein SAMN04488004_101127 [Loktanella salsilacus]
MCWSGEASAALAIVGISTTVYAAYKKEPAPLWMALGYFSSMELLQAFTYSVIDQCALPSNQVATLLSYLHIVFQPFFINMLSMYFIPDAVRVKIQWPVYTVCFASAIVMLLQLYPFAWAGLCPLGEVLCAERLCSVSGNWHIAWEVPTNGMLNFITVDSWASFLTAYPTYFIAAFAMPLLYGSWRITIYHFLIGPQLAVLLTNDPNEVAAIWCLLSIGILLLVVKTPIRRFMFVKSWLLWPKQSA